MYECRSPVVSTASYITMITEKPDKQAPSGTLKGKVLQRRAVFRPMWQIPLIGLI